MEDNTRSGGGTQTHRKFLGVKAQCMDSGKNGSKEELDANELLHHNK